MDFSGIFVPILAASAAGLAGRDYQDCIYSLGGRLELGLTDVAAKHGDGVAGELWQTWNRTRTCWNALSRGQTPTHWVALEQVVHSAKQDTRKKHRRDLVDELDTLGSHTALGGVCKELLVESPNLDAVVAAGAPFSIRCEAAGDNLVTTRIETPKTLSGTLPGGPSCPGEIRRVIILKTNHAKWRDCARRRLAEIEVRVAELWLPGPALLETLRPELSVAMV